MAQGWAGFSEEELRRLKQTKGYKCPGLWSDSSRLMRRQTTKLCDSRYCKNLLQRQEEPHSAGDWMELGKISQSLCVSRGAFSRIHLNHSDVSPRRKVDNNFSEKKPL
uniref:Golgin, RAB6 interacting n=1 Tax=Homo sapiens TaxID=9606 RepID=A0A8I5KV22_HUMAN